MLILAIESSCDETAAAVVKDAREIISNIVHTQLAEHSLYGGVVPEIASRRHMEKLSSVTKEALQQANLSLEEIDAIAVTAGPGLIGALLAGVNFAKGLAFASNKPLIPVHHVRGHVAACYLADSTLEPPFLCLSVSGGNSLIVRVDDYTDFKLLGYSRDDAAGEAFDKAARAMGLGYPGGVYIDNAAQSGNPDAYKLPSPHVEGSRLDMSFSGIKTAVVNLIHNAEQKGLEINKNDLSASFQKTVGDILINRLMLSCEMTGIKICCLAGGVSANSYLRSNLQKECLKRNIRLIMPPLSLTGDNAAMIGAQGYYEYLAGNVAKADLNAVATLSIEGVTAESFRV